MIVTIATLKVREEKIAEFESEFAKLADAVHLNEPGALFYQLCRSRSDVLTYRVFEAYQDAEAFEVHRASAHFREIAPRLAGSFTSAPEIEHCDSVGV